MKEIRQYIERLRTLKQRDKPTVTMYRLVAPMSVRFTISKIIRAEPVLPPQITERAGTLPEINYLLQWGDSAKETTNVATVANLGADFAAILAFAAGRKVMFAYEMSLRREDANILAFMELPRFGGQ